MSRSILVTNFSQTLAHSPSLSHCPICSAFISLPCLPASSPKRSLQISARPRHHHCQRRPRYSYIPATFRHSSTSPPSKVPRCSAVDDATPREDPPIPTDITPSIPAPPVPTPKPTPMPPSAPLPATAFPSPSPSPPPSPSPSTSPSPSPSSLSSSSSSSSPVKTVSSTSTTSPSSPLQSTKRAQHDRFKVQRRIAVGFVMGAVVIAFVFSARWIFAGGMLTISLIGLYEYYRMVAAKGHLPAYKMGLCVTTVTMLSSAFAPTLADVALPVGGTCICIYLLFRRSKIATIADISTTFMGLFYAGYLPSYWVRLHEFQPHMPDNVVASIVGKLWPGALLGFRPTITIGSLLVFWTWLAAASADIGAFFVGRTYGRTRFSNISPKKTVEGALAGFICSASISILGAYLLRWPVWWATGAVYGFVVGVLGLCGDLFESCFKRDVGWKDSGSLFPGHGGMLDRADSYVLVAPLVYFFATLVLPWITRVVR